MKTYLLAAALALTNAYSTNISTDIHWGEYSSSAFSLTILGTGLNFSDTITSPNGLWELQVAAHGQYLPQQGGIDIWDWAKASYLGLPGHPSMNTRGYTDLKPVADTLFDSGSFDNDYLWESGWHGRIPFLITSIPDLYDNSTWQWVLNISAHGKNLAVPEGGSAWALMALASGILFIFRLKMA